MDIISRPQAKQNGLTRFFTGKKCAKGHLSERMTSNGHCVLCLRQDSAPRLKARARVPEIKATYNQTRIAARLAIKLDVLAHYGGKCSCCGEFDEIFLNIDHINQEGATHRKSMGSRTWGGKLLYRWLQKNNYPEGFRVMCFNCNFAIYHRGVCPHQTAATISRTEAT